MCLNRQTINVDGPNKEFTLHLASLTGMGSVLYTRPRIHIQKFPCNTADSHQPLTVCLFIPELSRVHILHTASTSPFVAIIMVDNHYLLCLTICVLVRGVGLVDRCSKQNVRFVVQKPIIHQFLQISYDYNMLRFLNLEIFVLTD